MQVSRRVLLRRDIWNVNQSPIFQYISKTLTPLQEIQAGQTAAGNPVIAVVDTWNINVLVSMWSVGQNESPHLYTEFVYYLH